VTQGEEKGVDPIYRYVGNRLRHFRRERGLRQAAMAEVIGISTQQYQKYEDARSKCSLTNLYALADYLEIDPSAILPVSLQNTNGSPIAEKESLQSALENKNSNHSETQTSPVAIDVGRLVAAFLSIEESETRDRILGIVETMADQ